jgi:uncharacterized lipoprotein YmbA
MVKHIAGMLVAAVAALALAACGTTAPARFYALSSTSTAATSTATAGAPAGSVTVIVGPVSIPATVDRPEFVTTASPNSVEVNAFNRWAEPLNDGIARTVAGDLAAQLGGATVAVAPLANFAPTYRVSLRVQRFESVLNQSVLVEAVWVVRKEPNGSAQSGHTLARETVSGSGFDALTAAHSRALATISADIAAAIRAPAT